MTLDNLQNCTLTTCKKDDTVTIYDFVADSGYCFRNNAEPLIHDDGNTYFDHSTAISLLAHEIDRLADYECVKFEEGMVIH